MIGAQPTGAIDGVVITAVAHDTLTILRAAERAHDIGGDA